MAEKRMTKLEANKLRDSGQVGEVFHHVEFGVFNVHDMRRFIKEHPTYFPTQSTPFADVKWAGDMTKGGDAVMAWLEKQHEIDWERVDALTPEELADPIINVIDNKGTGHSFIIDGIHRLAGRRKNGMTDFLHYLFPLQVALNDFMIPSELAFAFDRPWGKTDVRNGRIVNAETGKPINEN